MKKYLINVMIILMMISILSSCGQSPETLYKLIVEELKISNSLENDYFSQYYDKNAFNEAKSAAETAIKDSNEEVYEEVLHDIKRENSNFKTFIDSEKGTIYNKQTSNTLDEKYPFKVTESFLEGEWDARPVVDITSSHPSHLTQTNSQYSDQTPDVHMWINGSSREYQWSTNLINTKEIYVMESNDSFNKALVNTEVQFLQKNRHPVNINEATLLNERPAYLIVDKDDRLVLLLESYDKENYYIPYVLYE